MLLCSVDCVWNYFGVVFELFGIILQQYNVLCILCGVGFEGLLIFMIGECMMEKMFGIIRFFDWIE